MSISDRLDEIQARTDNATEGPWWGSMISAHVEMFAGEGSGSDPLLASGVLPGNAEFIASARTDVPRLVAALRAVLDLHEGAPNAVSAMCPNPACNECGQTMPCPTVRAIATALGQEASDA